MEVTYLRLDPVQPETDIFNKYMSQQIVYSSINQYGADVIIPKTLPMKLNGSTLCRNQFWYDNVPDLIVTTVQPKPKFNIGDRVIIKYNDYTGTIVRLPMEGVNYPDGYVVELDNKRFGWTGTHDCDGVECNGGWFAAEKNLELINEVALEPNKWYHTTDFTVDELQALLPSGTQVEVEVEVLYNNIDTPPPTKTKRATVEKVTISDFREKVYIGTVGDNFYKEWFKIVQED